MSTYQRLVRTDLNVLGVGPIPAGEMVAVTVVDDPLARDEWHYLEYGGVRSPFYRPGQMQLLLGGVPS